MSVETVAKPVASDKCATCKCPKILHITWGGQHHRCKQGKSLMEHSGYHGYCMVFGCSCVIHRGDNKAIS
jgi:hypothetical protein